MHLARLPSQLCNMPNDSPVLGKVEQGKSPLRGGKVKRDDKGKQIRNTGAAIEK